jgi:MFS family permease
MNRPKYPLSDTANLGLIVAIASITGVGVGISLAIPLLSLTLEGRGIPAGWIGVNAAAWGLASMAVTPFVPRLAAWIGTRRLLAGSILVNAATLPLFHAVDDFWLWFPLRFISGASLAASFALSEFWISAVAPAARRGFVMGIYATVLSLGFALGPAVLAVTGTEGLAPFAIGAAVIGIAALPVLLAPVSIPAIDAHRTGAFWRILVAAPAATGAGLLFGFAESGSLALLPIYGSHLGHATEAVVLLAVAFTLGNVASQVPIGLVSDRIDRRLFLLIIATGGLVGVALLPIVSSSLPAMFFLLFIWGGLIGGLYTVGLAHLSARFTGADLAAANSAFVFCYAAGALVGPAALGFGMELSDPHGFAVVLAACFVAYLVLLIARMAARR